MAKRKRHNVAGWVIAGAVGLAVAHAHTAAPAAAPAATVTATSSGCGGSNEALANCMAASGYGWTGPQTTCLDDLWNNESGFDAYAANSTSDARGIPQKITGWSADYQPGNARQQITWGLDYIRGRYGTPCAAWNFEISHVPNWY